MIGSVGLVFLSGGSLLAAGFFYLLAAVLMPASAPARPALAGGELSMPTGGISVAGACWQTGGAHRVDFAGLDRQLDVLDRRIRSMGGTVTERHYDWDRRLDS